MNVKDILRELLIVLHIDLTRNLKYDRLSKEIMKKVLRPGNICVDVGCHKGEMLALMMKYAPGSTHYAFEPIPSFFTDLRKKFGNKVRVFACALSDTSGTTTFQVVKNAPAYSGIRRRSYDIAHPDIEEIQVELKTMDEVVGVKTPVRFIKIDVEGGEFGVLRGAKAILSASNPVVLFECGLGASEYYGTKPGDVYHFLTVETKLKIFTLSGFLKHEPELSIEGFEQCYSSGCEYYFVAAPAAI